MNIYITYLTNMSNTFNLVQLYTLTLVKHGQDFLLF